MLKFLLITVCIILLLRMFGKFFIVRTFNSMNQKMQNEMNRRQGNAKQQMPEGSITIDPSVQKQQNKRNNQKDDNDFVDYEEVK
ncbi:MAG: DUF4834 family protein [Bacteroidetes bacterium]|nr:DUF4834 family protein [Bacteroidota bacterium]